MLSFITSALNLDEWLEFHPRSERSPALQAVMENIFSQKFWQDDVPRWRELIEEILNEI
jgi:hypothetical protein